MRPVKRNDPPVKPQLKVETVMRLS